MKFFGFLVFIVLLLSSVSCSKDESYGNGTLVFSQDTVDFYTVYAEQGSSTQRFKIYNKSGAKLNIQSIELMNPDKFGFSMVLDGESGTSFSNVEIAAKDSLQAFIQLNLPTQLQSSQVKVSGSIRFHVGGETQYVYLKAIGHDVYVFTNKVIAQDTTLTSKKIILVNGELRVNEGVTLRMEANTRLLFRNKASMVVDGMVEIAGSRAFPVVMKNDRTDLLDNAIPYELIPGQWEGVRFTSKSYGNKIENLSIYNAIHGLTFEESDPLIQKANMKNVIVQNTTKSGATMINCKIDAVNCLFANSGGAALTVAGGDYTFNHCTIANYYNWGTRKDYTFNLANVYNLKLYPLLRCDVVNSIVYGYYTDELDITMLGNGGDSYKFISSLIKGEELGGSKFENMYWNLDPLFVDNGKSSGLTFNFNLTEQSPAREKANRIYSNLVPFDLAGNSRLDLGQPDLGCLEFIPKQ